MPNVYQNSTRCQFLDAERPGREAAHRGALAPAHVQAAALTSRLRDARRQVPACPPPCRQQRPAGVRQGDASTCACHMRAPDDVAACRPALAQRRPAAWLAWHGADRGVPPAACPRPRLEVGGFAAQFSIFSNNAAWVVRWATCSNFQFFTFRRGLLAGAPARRVLDSLLRGASVRSSGGPGNRPWLWPGRRGRWEGT